MPVPEESLPMEAGSIASEVATQNTDGMSVLCGSCIAPHGDVESVLCVWNLSQGGTVGGTRVTGGSISEKIPVHVRGIGRGEEGSPVVLQKGARRRSRSGGMARAQNMEMERV